MPRTTEPRRSCATPPISTSGPLRAGSLALAVVAAAANTRPLVAQQFWRANFYPYVSYSPSIGLAGALHYGRYSPLGFVERPERNRASLSLDAGASTQGSYRVVADAQAPAWWDGWRAGLTLTAARDNRLGYYGMGNFTRYSRDSVTSRGAYYYRVSRSRLAARATLQRRVVGPVRLLVGG